MFEDGLIADIEIRLRYAYNTQKQEGQADEGAFQKTVSQVGLAESIAAEYDKKRTVLIDRRSRLRIGRFILALIWNCRKTALSTIRRYKGYSLINISSLAIGLTVCLLIVFWVADEWSFDRFISNADRIYRIYRNESATKAKTTSVLTTPLCSRLACKPSEPQKPILSTA